jgi:CheY-like chemotaxis protein
VDHEENPRKTVLVVEDSEDVFLLRHAFKRAKITNPLHISGTGEDAIAYLAGTAPYGDWHKFPMASIVLLDLKLPGLSGFDVLGWIRQHPGMKGLPVIMLTTSDLKQEINKAYELGANAFLTKPVDLDKLIEMMKVFKAHWLEFAQAPEISRSKP